AQDVVELRAAELLGGGVICCPNPKMTLWNQHPRVFIDIAATGEGRCPYCGTVYRLRAGETLAHGH
ncbi:MAG: zinc-finger domain-containing protein, partial [Rubrivivax sp.]